MTEGRSECASAWLSPAAMKESIGNAMLIADVRADKASGIGEEEEEEEEESVRGVLDEGGMVNVNERCITL